MKNSKYRIKYHSYFFNLTLDQRSGNTEPATCGLFSEGLGETRQFAYILTFGQMPLGKGTFN